MLDKRRDKMLARLLAVTDDIDACLLLVVQGQSQGISLPSINSSSCNFQGDQSFSGCASQEGFGRLPAVDVGNSVFMIGYLVFWSSTGAIRR